MTYSICAKWHLRKKNKLLKVETPSGSWWVAVCANYNMKIDWFLYSTAIYENTYFKKKKSISIIKLCSWKSQGKKGDSDGERNKKKKLQMRGNRLKRATEKKFNFNIQINSINTKVFFSLPFSAFCTKK